MSKEKNIPKRWQIKKLGEVCEITTGDKDVNEGSKNGVYPFFTCAKENYFFDSYSFDGDSILIAGNGNFSVKKYSGKFEAYQRTYVLQKFKIDYKYLFYNLQGNLHIITKGNRGSTVRYIRIGDLTEYAMSIPTLPEQQAIVAKIEELLSDLENGKQQLQTAQQQLKVYRQSLLKWAFEGKLTNKNLKEGELPKGWTLKKLNEIGTWKGGGTPSKSRKDFWENGNILWVSPKDMKTQKIYDTIDKITTEAIENSSTKLISKGSVLFVVRSGILRRTLPVALTISDVTVNQDLQALTPKDILPDYVYWYVCAKNDDIRKTCSKDGTTVESIESQLLKNYSIPICSLEEQQLIVSELESKLTVCDKIEETISQSLQQAETLRQSILKKAFEGKLVQTEEFTSKKKELA